MTDKQIIIDGVDITNCIHRATNKLCGDINPYCRCYTGSCKDISNCYYKQLKQTLIEIKEIANYSFDLSTSELLSKLEQILQKISEISDGRHEVSPDSELKEPTRAEPARRKTVSVEKFQDSEVENVNNTNKVCIHNCE